MLCFPVLRETRRRVVRHENERVPDSTSKDLPPMPKRIPKYGRHRARNKGNVTLNGKTHYLPGDYDSDQSRAEYDRLISENLAKPKTP
jgi:hypothetical protein